MWIYNETQYNDELYHYGIPGMKWGFRKATYRLRSAKSLRKSLEGIKKDNQTITKKNDISRDKMLKYIGKAKTYSYKATTKQLKNQDSTRAERSRDKNQAKANKYQGKMITGTYQIHRNKKLMELYKKRIDKLESTKTAQNQAKVDKFVSDLGIMNETGTKIDKKAVNNNLNINNKINRRFKKNYSVKEINKDIKRREREDKLEESKKKYQNRTKSK